jgi:H+-transporting ATPase
VRWNMQRILLFASIMGSFSVVETFGLLILGLRWVGDDQFQELLMIDPAQLQTVLFLQLAVGGHLLLFVVRTKRSLFQPPYPSPRLFWAIVATQVAAVAICWLGIGVPAIPPAAILGVWIYCLVWMVVLDALKLVCWRFADGRDAAIRRQYVSLSA